MLSVMNHRSRSSFGYFRRMSSLGVAHEALINHDFIDAASTRLVRDKKTKLKDVNSFLEAYKSNMNSSNMIHFLNTVGKRKLLLPSHIFVVASRLRAEYPEGIALSQVDRIVDSLKYYPANIGSVRILLAVVTESLLVTNDIVDSARVGNYLFCLRDMKSGYLEVRDFIDVMAKKIEVMEEGILREDVSKALAGMQLLSSKHPEVVNLVSVISKKIVAENAEDGFFTGDQFCRLLLGFQRLDLDIPQVNVLLSACLEKVDIDNCEIRTVDRLKDVFQVVGTLSGKGGSIGSRLAALLHVLISKCEHQVPDVMVRRAVDNLELVITHGNRDESLASLLLECRSRL